MKDNIQTNILELIEKHTAEDSLVKTKLSGIEDSSIDYKDLTIKVVELKAGRRLQFSYRYEYKVVTKNYTIDESITILKQLLVSTRNVALVTSEATYQYNQGKEKLFRNPHKIKRIVNKNHDKKKQHLVSQESLYLKHLDITNSSGNIKKGKGDKFIQINKYIELLSSLIKEAKLKPDYHVVDMGCGKGYLTFALYDFLNTSSDTAFSFTGVEIRPELVEYCSATAKVCGFDKLTFETSDIEGYTAEQVDVLIALHACDTATDDAIAKGISSGAKLIACSPCCHKQIRKEMQNDIELNALTRFGIIKERQAELITDVIRSLILELHGYKTKIMEFVNTEHTSKNLLITAIKQDGKVKKEELKKEIKKLKSSFGIKTHYLETALNLDI